MSRTRCYDYTSEELNPITKTMKNKSAHSQFDISVSLESLISQTRAYGISLALHPDFSVLNSLAVQAEQHSPTPVSQLSFPMSPN
jgi:hypothetical protein